MAQLQLRSLSQDHVHCDLLEIPELECHFSILYGVNRLSIFPFFDLTVMTLCMSYWKELYHEIVKCFFNIASLKRNILALATSTKFVRNLGMESMKKLMLQDQLNEIDLQLTRISLANQVNICY